METRTQHTPGGTKYVYLNSEPGLWTVGYYSPDGKWQPESDLDDKDKAARRVAWLNGSSDAHDDAAPDLVEACKAAVENCTRALECGDRGDWASAEIFINNQRGIAEAALAKAGA